MGDGADYGKIYGWVDANQRSECGSWPYPPGYSDAEIFGHHGDCFRDADVIVETSSGYGNGISAYCAGCAGSKDRGLTLHGLWLGRDWLIAEPTASLLETHFGRAIELTIPYAELREAWADRYHLQTGRLAPPSYQYHC